MTRISVKECCSLRNSANGSSFPFCIFNDPFISRSVAGKKRIRNSRTHEKMISHEDTGKRHPQIAQITQIEKREHDREGRWPRRPKLILECVRQGTRRRARDAALFSEDKRGTSAASGVSFVIVTAPLLPSSRNRCPRIPKKQETKLYNPVSSFDNPTRVGARRNPFRNSPARCDHNNGRGYENTSGESERTIQSSFSGRCARCETIP